MIIKDTFRRPARQDLDLAKLPGGMPALSSLKLLPYKENAWTATHVARRSRRSRIMIQETR